MMIASRQPGDEARWRMRVAVMCSKRAPGLRYLLSEDRNRGSLYDIVGCVTSHRDCVEIDRLREARIPYSLHDIHTYYEMHDDRMRAPIGDLDARGDYDRATVSILTSYRPDLVVLSGYVYIITRPLLDAFVNRIISVHHSGLAAKHGGEEHRYVGLHAVRDAILAGERYTRSTVHIVTTDLDAGPPLFRSWPFRINENLVKSARDRGSTPILKAYAYAHREWMMQESWGPLLARAIESFARDQIFVEDDVAWIAGAPGPRDLAPDEFTSLSAGRVFSSVE